MNNEEESRYHKIVSGLLKNDPFSQWMGIKIAATDEGYCKLTCRISEQMLNGYRVSHGGIVFSLADTALAFAAATLGRVSLAIDHSISFVKSTVTGEEITAEAKVLHATHRTGVIQVQITNAAGELIALSKGTVYRKNEEFTVK